MKNNKKEMQKNAFNDLFATTSKEQVISAPIIEEVNIIQPKEEIKKEVSNKDKTTIKRITCRKTYNLPVDIIENITKILYMDRDTNTETEFIIKALEKYLDSKECKALLEEYNVLKGIN